MEQTNQPNTNQVGTQPQPQQLDPQAVMLAQSIRDVESGGDFQAKGASGEYGAYQWEPDTWNAMSKEAGVNVPLESSTPEQQNQVAYTQIKNWKDQGKNVGQIASMWNGGAGNPDAYTQGDSGTNSKGVSYNVPQYAQKVAQTYQDLKSNAQDETIDPTSSPTSDPKYQAISTNQNSMPTWGKWILGGLLTAGGIAAAAVTGGADLPEVAAGDAAIAGLGDAAGATAADAGATAGATAASGAADASEAEPGVISKLVGGAKNLAEGAATVSGAEGIAKDIFGGNQSQSQPTEQPTPTIDNTQLPDALGASRQIYSTMNEALGQTPTGRVYANTPAGQSGLQGLSEYGIAPEDVEGNYDSTQADEKAQTVLEGLSDNMGQVLDAEGESANLNEAISEATQGMKKVTPSNEWGEAEAHIKQQAETYRQFADENGNMSLGNFERMKKEQYRAAGKWDTTTTSAKKAAHKSLGLGARSTIVKHTKHKELYERAMHEEKKIINGRKILKKINGKKIKKKSGAIQSMLHNLGHYAAIAIGDKIGGPLGAIVGEVVGNTITRGIEKKYGSNILDTPAMKKALALVGKNKPQVLDIIKKEIKKYETMAQKEKEMSGKRAAYKEKKSAILNPKSKPSEYEPYQSPYTIAMGRRPKKKETLPVIRA